MNGRLIFLLIVVCLLAFCLQAFAGFAIETGFHDGGGF
jgi:hypothetical protein